MVVMALPWFCEVCETQAPAAAEGWVVIHQRNDSPLPDGWTEDELSEFNPVLIWEPERYRCPEHNVWGKPSVRLRFKKGCGCGTP